MISWIFEWLEWNIYAYWPSLVICIISFTIHYRLMIQHQSFSGVALAMYVGFCLCVVYCAFRYGYAVG